MQRLIILIVAGFLLYLAYRKFSRLSKEQKKQKSMYILAAVVLVGMIFLAVTGRLSLLGAALTALIATIPRLMRTGMKVWPFLRQFQNIRTAQQARNAKMRTAYVQIIMDAQTGKLNGKILKGTYEGRQLSEMSQQECLLFLDECSDDMQSASLMMSYLDANYTDWRSSYQGRSQQRSANKAASAMSKQQASEVLGVDVNADIKTVKVAHKRLMQKLHPDRGGSDYLAAQINEARDVMLS